MAMLVYLRKPENSPEKKLSRPKKVISQQVLCIDSIGWLDVGIKKASATAHIFQSSIASEKLGIARIDQSSRSSTEKWLLGGMPLSMQVKGWLTWIYMCLPGNSQGTWYPVLGCKYISIRTQHMMFVYIIFIHTYVYCIKMYKVEAKDEALTMYTWFQGATCYVSDTSAWTFHGRFLVHVPRARCWWECENLG